MQLAATGFIQGSYNGGGAVFGDIAMTETDCIDTANRIWDVMGDAQRCNGVYLF